MASSLDLSNPTPAGVRPSQFVPGNVAAPPKKVSERMRAATIAPVLDIQFFILAAPAVFAHDEQVASRPILDAGFMHLQPILEPLELKVADIQRRVCAEIQFADFRSEERRVGKECRSRWS